MKAVGILGDDARAMHCQAALDPKRTFTESYRHNYAAFVEATACKELKLVGELRGPEAERAAGAFAGLVLP